MKDEFTIKPVQSINGQILMEYDFNHYPLEPGFTAIYSYVYPFTEFVYYEALIQLIWLYMAGLRILDKIFPLALEAKISITNSEALRSIFIYKKCD